MKGNLRLKHTVPLAIGGLMLLSAACKTHMPHAFTWPAGGDIQQTHAKPPEGGYMSNWDPFAVELEVVPVEDVNPVRTQHYLVATVRDKNGKPLPNRRVEWIINKGSVGDIVEVDESGWRASRGYKVTNDYAISHTNNFKHVLDMGNSDPSDDIALTAGQTWCVITSPIEGDTFVTVYAPGIYDTAKHKVFATKHWYDVNWAFPPPATNPTGSTHNFVTVVTKASDGSPLAGYEVTYAILDGPAGSFDNGQGTIMVKTDNTGTAKVTLKQAKPAEGTNNVSIDIMRPENAACCKPPVHIANGRTAKTWIGPKIACNKTGPGTVLAGAEFEYQISVNNPSQVTATGVTVTDALPNGIAYVSSTPAAANAGGTLTWNLGSVAAGATQTITIKAKATQTGTFENCCEVRADQGLSSRCCAKTTAQSPKLVLEKKCTPEVTVCDAIEYVITVRNAGDGPANNVVVTDNLPAGLTTSDGKTSVVSNVGTLAAGQAKEVRFMVKATKPGKYDNNVSATADGGLKADAMCSTVVRQPVLQVTKTGPSERYIGRVADYEITVSNTGDTAARGTVLTDPIPGSTEFVSASDGGQLSGGVVTWSLGDLGAGQSKKVTLKLKALAAGSAKNTAKATAACAEATATTDMVMKGVPAILLEVVDQEDPIEVGANEIYTITVTNQGSAADVNIVVICTLPAQEDFVSADGPTKGTGQGKTVTFAPLPSLAPKAQVVYKVIVKGNAAADARFKVSITSDMIETPVEETESTHIY